MVLIPLEGYGNPPCLANATCLSLPNTTYPPSSVPASSDVSKGIMLSTILSVGSSPAASRNVGPQLIRLTSSLTTLPGLILPGHLAAKATWLPKSYKLHFARGKPGTP